MLHNWVRRPDSRKVCKDCQNKLRCGACKQLYNQNSWSRKERENHKQRQTTLVCKPCRDLGYHPDDVETYACRICKCEFGAKKFDANMLSNYKYNSQPKIECKECTATAERRVKELRGKLKGSKRICKCFCPIHQWSEKFKCPLAPVVYHEKRWPGSDTGITAEDRKFLDGLNPQPAWWRKAWGRSA